MRKTKKRLTKRKPPDQEDDEAACNLTAQFPEDESQQKEDALVIPTEAEGSAVVFHDVCSRKVLASCLAVIRLEPRVCAKSRVFS
jgi:hypothetical protein